MNALFYLSAAIAVVSTLMVVIHSNAVHALLYLIVSLLAVAVVFFLLGAPFVAALEVILYAGAIMVLFVFVIMMLNLGPHAAELEQRWLRSVRWGAPVVLAALLVGELLYVGAQVGVRLPPGSPVGPRAVGAALLGPYLLGVEMASLLMLVGLVGAYHLGRRGPERTTHSSREAGEHGDRAA